MHRKDLQNALKAVKLVLTVFQLEDVDYNQPGAQRIGAEPGQVSDVGHARCPLPCGGEQTSFPGAHV